MIICVILVAVATGLLLRTDKGSGIPFNRYEGDTLRCAIMLKHSMFAKTTKNAGFNYELLSAFGSDTRLNVKIDPPVESPQCWEDLISGETGIIVFNMNDSIPEQYADSVLFSVPVKDNDVWVVSKSHPELLNCINFWFNGFQNNDIFQTISRRYFRTYNVENLIAHDIPVTALSPYDDIIKKYSSRIGLDWRLLSSIIYQESRFSMGASSGKSARGLMQIRESTARKYGITNLYDPESNVRAGTMHFNHLLKTFQNEGLDSANVIKFALAAYNGGEARLEDLRQYAFEQGYDPNDWESVHDSFKVKDGPTSTYVSEILARYELYKSVIE